MLKSVYACIMLDLTLNAAVNYGYLVRKKSAFLKNRKADYILKAV